ncbi:hypothetical protein V1520DRAFT_380928 [Lipomyces starkeyi]|uniref:Uncharacterized protein n=1 Tax=Lipomyces starkeyi NRRL Y-11557 TaxID=675824 RepID=A0A1E3Q527_LIPST|nr:hypothetical protein LIPSTDRAFT_64008 [Lipomyces starkeyi NRRL Y-11557]
MHLDERDLLHHSVRYNARVVEFKQMRSRLQIADMGELWCFMELSIKALKDKIKLYKMQICVSLEANRLSILRSKEIKACFDREYVRYGTSLCETNLQYMETSQVYHGLLIFAYPTCTKVAPFRSQSHDRFQIAMSPPISSHRSTTFTSTYFVGFAQWSFHALKDAISTYPSKESEIAVPEPHNNVKPAQPANFSTRWRVD